MALSLSFSWRQHNSLLFNSCKTPLDWSSFFEPAVLYSCNEESLSSAAAVQESVAAAFELADIELDEINYQVMDDEIVVLAIAKQFHFTLHAYPELGYVAVDLFAFNRTLPLTQFMKSLRQSFGSEKVKATTVQRGDFGNERDMKPRRKTKITTLGRVFRTRIQLKQTGGKLKKQSAKVIKSLAKKSGLKK